MAKMLQRCEASCKWNPPVPVLYSAEQIFVVPAYGRQLTDYTYHQLPLAGICPSLGYGWLLKSTVAQLQSREPNFDRFGKACIWGLLLYSICKMVCWESL